uniref:Uncharacterized protein n=1 Tax=Oryza brachyantha TaxID=4533 RepID=J3LZE7_ORYBR
MTSNIVVVLVDSRNLILSDASNSSIIFRESFNHMADTFLHEDFTRGLVSNQNFVDLSPNVYSATLFSDFSNPGLFLASN